MTRWPGSEEKLRFERLFSPHLNAAYNLARWLVKDTMAAQDIVQDSCLRAYAAQYRFSDGNPRAWLLKIVRNQSYTWLKAQTGMAMVDADDEAALTEADKATLSHAETPEKLAASLQDTQKLHEALNTLPAVFREVIILKEMEELAYKEIALITSVPIGTVMSRLARGRELLKKELLKHHA